MQRVCLRMTCERVAPGQGDTGCGVMFEVSRTEERCGDSSVTNRNKEPLRYYNVFLYFHALSFTLTQQYKHSETDHQVRKTGSREVTHLCTTLCQALLCVTSVTNQDLNYHI